MNNFFIQDQINHFLTQTNASMSISRRFIREKDVRFIHDSIFARATSDWEFRLIERAITLSHRHSIEAFKCSNSLERY